MERRVAALLRIWEEEGVRVEWDGKRFVVQGIETPGWWSDWCERHQTELFSLLVLTVPEPEPVRAPLWEDRRHAWNSLSAPVDREREHKPVRLSDRRLQMLERLRQFAEL